MDETRRRGIVGVGHDLQQVDEVRPCEALQTPEVFLTSREADDVRTHPHSARRLATYFCVKEAFFKACPVQTSWCWSELELVASEGRPALVSHGHLRRVVRSQRWDCLVSVSHSGDYVSAYVLLFTFEGNGLWSLAGRTMKQIFEPTTLELSTRPNDLDRLGHVNNAVILEYFEAARWDWLEQMGLSERREILPVVARIEVDYLAQIFPTRVRVESRLIVPDEASWPHDISYKAVMRQTVRLANGNDAARASVTIAFVDGNTGSLTTLQDCLSATSQTRPVALAESARPLTV